MSMTIILKIGNLMQGMGLVARMRIWTRVNPGPGLRSLTDYMRYIWHVWLNQLGQTPINSKNTFSLLGVI